MVRRAEAGAVFDQQFGSFSLAGYGRHNQGRASAGWFYGVEVRSGSNVLFDGLKIALGRSREDVNIEALDGTCVFVEGEALVVGCARLG